MENVNVETSWIQTLLHLELSTFRHAALLQSMELPCVLPAKYSAVSHKHVMLDRRLALSSVGR
jgi:hypothetical protein